MPPGCRILFGLVALAMLSSCAATAASKGATPIEQISAPPDSSATTEPPDVTSGLAAPSTSDSIVAAVDELLGGQASVSRPVGDDSARPSITDDRVFILGDSITEAGGPANYDTIRQALVPLGWRPTIDAVKGRTTEQGGRVLQKRRRDIHDVVVVLLGHNDPVDPIAYRAQLDAIVEQLAAVPLVVFLTNEEFEKGRDRMNDQLRVVDALNDNVVLVDWNAVVQHTPHAVGPDGLHLTEQGARALAATIAVSLGVAPDGPSRVGS